jgi:hypothetical protein
MKKVVYLSLRGKQLNSACVESLQMFQNDKKMVPISFTERRDQLLNFKHCLTKLQATTQKFMQVHGKMIKR